MILFGGIGLVMNFVMYWFSDNIALASNGAQPVTREQLPEVYDIVEQLTRKEGMPMPRLYLIPSEAPNAFAAGRNPAHAAVAVTQGILRRRAEGVIAHELGHVKNRDILNCHRGGRHRGARLLAGARHPVGRDVRRIRRPGRRGPGQRPRRPRVGSPGVAHGDDGPPRGLRLPCRFRPSRPRPRPTPPARGWWATLSRSPRSCWG